MSASQLVSAFGVVGILFLAWLFCRHRGAVNWRTVVWGTLLQFVFALLILKTAPGQWLFLKANDAVVTLIAFQEEGAKFVFSSLAIPPGEPGSMGFFFAFQVLTTIIFLSSLMSALYYLGVMERVVLFFGRIMQYSCRTSGAETLNAAANIFMGQTEAPLMVRPHIEEMTDSELLCVMVAGMATISAGVLVAYVAMLRPYFPDVAGRSAGSTFVVKPGQPRPGLQGPELRRHRGGGQRRGSGPAARLERGRHARGLHVSLGHGQLGGPPSLRSPWRGHRP